MTIRHGFHDVAPGSLIDSPFQPRIDYTGMDDLTASVKAEGRVHQALLARPIGADDQLELVFGHRRKRAAIAAGLATVKVEVRTMTDAEVRSAQMAENVQREAMKAIEEAQGLQAQMQADAMSADQLAEKLGKSRRWVYGRLQLLKLVPSVRAALDAGDIDAEVALIVARVGSEKMQQKALGYIKGKYWDLEDNGRKSVRQIKELLNERFTLTLDKKVFDYEDETLLPWVFDQAGFPTTKVGSCVQCPKRAGNAPVFEDVARDVDAQRPKEPAEDASEEEWDAYDQKLGEFDQQRYARDRDPYFRHAGADVCTDPDCFAEKKKAHLKRESAKMRAEGKTVIDGGKARQLVDAQGNVKGAYVSLASVKAQLQKISKGKPQPEVVSIQNPRDGKWHEAVKVEDLKAAGIKPKDAAQTARQQQADQSRAYAEKRNAQVEEARRLTEQRMALLQRVRQVGATRDRDVFDLRLITAAALSGVPWDEKETLAKLWDVKGVDALKKRIDTMSAAELTTLVMDCAIVDNVRVEWHTVGNKPGPLMALAGHYGINAKAVMAEATSTPSTAGASADTAAAGAKKATTAKGSKARKSQKDDASASADAEQTDDAGSAGEEGRQ